MVSGKVRGMWALRPGQDLQVGFSCSTEPWGSEKILAGKVEGWMLRRCGRRGVHKGRGIKG